MLKKTQWDLQKIIEIVYLFAVTALSLFLKIRFVRNIPTKPVFDFAAYQEIASNIFNNLGHTYGGQHIAFQGMGYPTALGFIYKLAGNNDEMTAKIFNIVLSMLTLIIIYLILIKITQSRLIIYGAYTITALLPNYIAYNNVIGTEVFFTFLFSIILLLQVYPFKPWIRYPLWGIFIGAAALTKPFFMAYPVVAAFMYWLKTKKLRQAVISFASLFLIMALVIAPWTYRNYKKFGRFIPISYNSGYVLYINNNHYNATGAWMDLQEADAPQHVKDQIAEILSQKDVKLAHEIEPIIKKQAKEWIRQNPLEFAKLGVLRLSSTFFDGSWDIDAWAMNDDEEIQKEYEKWNKKEKISYQRNKGFSRGLRDICIYILNSFGIIYALLCIFPILTAFFKKDRRIGEILFLPAVPTWFFIAVYFVYEGQSRYAFPLLFLFAIGMMVLVNALIKGLRTNRE